MGGPVSAGKAAHQRLARESGPCGLDSPRYNVGDVQHVRGHVTAPKPRRTLFAELQRRNVFRVALAYAGSAWILLQVADVLVPALRLPEWLITFVAVAAIVGFPIAVVLAWTFEWTAEGVVRDDAAVTTRVPLGGRLTDFIIIAILTVAVAWFAIDKFMRPAVPTAARPTIAVLPFDTLGDVAGREYFADGLSEELLNILMRIDGPRVIARTSSFSFRDRDQDLREIGRQLGADYLLEGTVAFDTDKVRVHTHLVDGGDGVRRWSDTFEASFDDAFQLQQLIARAVGAQLRIEVLELGSQPHNNEAYDLYLQGLRLSRVPDPSRAAQAIRNLEAAVALDPDFAPAWTQLAQAYLARTVAGVVAPDEGRRRAREAIVTALDADPKSADAWALLANMEMAFELDWNAAESAFLSALEFMPDHAGALRGAGSLAAAHGRLDEALALTLRSQRVDPLNVASMHNEAFVRYLMRDYAAAEEKFRTARQFAGEGYTLGRIMLSLSLIGQGEFEQALREIGAETVEPFRLAVQAVALGHLGRRAESAAALERLIERYGDRLAVPIAGALAQAGDEDQAFAWLEKAFAQKDTQLMWLGVHPLNDPLRDDQRYDSLLRRLGLAR